ncbi:enoyl-CoA hydratase/isomerase family protein [Halalkalicoccus jeotgali]|uniref:Enoyl-CoA hydratase n=1 Tax=Halalkalicoccus jeotgali (strain DSM 18796 / CECT 7217 / JCM 14584 / KCTC 4019 / B3) TaxID=795797 RepID=D8J8T0_HALJB|nr:enoyl-CoA hydratase/isomerase family protein [Halalkalicoccus jeotgali]ADJ14265.1 enoyl-CoA hydratase [Halalkalicoccus jeotgali B3]ELY40527.1 enoyl-CoA hydratase [Halalkalicoccus jeotgali B3]
MITTHARGDVRYVTLDRPERRNALTPEGLDELAHAVETADEPVVYLSGAGSAFCAGADLDVVADLEDGREFAERGQRTARAIERADSVVVAGIDGPARGGGLEMALACDLRIATPEASFGEPGVSFGLFGAWGGTVRLPRLVGGADARDLSLTGRVIDAEEALRMGLISRITDDPETIARETAGNDHHALALTKNRLHDDSSIETQEAAEASAFAELIDRYERP